MMNIVTEKVDVKKEKFKEIKTITETKREKNWEEKMMIIEDVRMRAEWTIYFVKKENWRMIGKV